MKIRTVYWKTHQLERAAAFWKAFLGAEPVKVFPEWQEFRVGELNLGLLATHGSEPAPRGSRCVPVFEFGDDEVERAIQRAKDLGATAVLEGQDHPDYPCTAAVLLDPFGNEFEVTNFHPASG